MGGVNSLATLQLTLHRLFRDELPVDAAAEALGADPRRLDIYHRAVHLHVRHALEANFPVTLASLPADTRTALHAAYFATHAPTTWNLDAAAEAFPDFLDASLAAEAPPPGLTPFHPALARLEWELTTVWGAEDTAPEDPTPQTAPTAPVLNPTLALLESPYPLVAYLARPDAASPDTLPAPAEAPELVLVFRHPSRRTACFYAATGDLLFALKVVHDGLDPQTAARAAGLDEAAALSAMALAVEVGLVVAPPDR